MLLISAWLRNKAYVNAAVFLIFVCSALVYSGNGYAQSRLHPGDMLFTGVNTANNEFKLVSFADIQPGTVLYVSSQLSGDGEQAETFLPELKILFEQPVERGTEILVPAAGEGQSLSSSGELLPFEGRTHLYLYQKENGRPRFLSGAAWGADGYTRRLSAVSDFIPEQLREPELNFISLGSGNQYAYSIRNGLSGTVKMLRKMLLTEANWQASADHFNVNPELRLNILEPPVIQFADNLSTAGADADSVKIKVAIFEHDGSKLLVTMGLNEQASTLSNADFSGFDKTQINFTGIIGDSDTEITLPLAHRPETTGPVTAIFELNGLSDGRFGDFVTHTLLLEEEKEAAVRMQVVGHNSGAALILYNPENREIDVGGWQLKQGRKTVTLPAGLLIKSRGKLILTPDKDFSSNSDNEDVFVVQEKEAEVFGEPGRMVLYTLKKQKIDEIEKPQQAKTVRAAASEVIPAGTEQDASVQVPAAASLTEATGGNWIALPYNAGIAGDNQELDFYYWSSRDNRFKPVNADEAHSTLPAVMKVFVDGKAADLRIKELFETQKTNYEANRLELTLVSECSRGESTDSPACGLNYLINTAGADISAGEIVRQLADRLQPARKPVIYAESALGIHSLSDSEYIAPGQSFWIQLHERTEPVTFYIEFDSAPKEKELTAEEEPAGFVLALKNEKGSRKITFLTSGGNSEAANRYTLDAVIPPVLTEQDGELAFAVRSGKSFLSTITRNVPAAESIGTPLFLSAGGAQNLTLGVSYWSGIPENVHIELEDLAENRTYELSPGWETTITAAVSKKTASSTEEPGEDEGIRFLLSIRPVLPAESVMGGQVEKPEVITLNQNYPNPFNPSTTISFYLPDEADVKLTIFNVVGQPVAELINSKLGPGTHKADWDASELPSGMYIYQLEAGTKIMTRKMMLVK